MGNYLDGVGIKYLWDKAKYLIAALKKEIEDKIGSPNGIAPLDSGSKLPAKHLTNLKTINNESIVGTGNITVDLSLFTLVNTLPPEGVESKIYLLPKLDIKYEYKQSISSDDTRTIDDCQIDGISTVNRICINNKIYYCTIRHLNQKWGLEDKFYDVYVVANTYAEVTYIPELQQLVIYNSSSDEIRNIKLGYSDLGENNLYEEWVYINDEWELLGSTSFKVDLSDYLSVEDIGQPDKVAGLDTNGKLPQNQLPDFKTINNQSILGTGNISIDLDNNGGIASKVANKLKFKGAVTAEYDGSQEVEVTIPQAGSDSSYLDKIGKPNGIAGLDSDGKVPESQLPSHKTINGQSILGKGNIELSTGGGGASDTANRVANSLIFEGAENKSYNGSEEIHVTIPEDLSNKVGKANGIANLDSGTKIPPSLIPTTKTINGESIFGEGDITLNIDLFKVVSMLPPMGQAKENRIYLVPITNDENINNYAEYIWIENKWELLGKFSTQVDLTEYTKFSDVVTHSKNGTMSKEDKIKLDDIEIWKGTSTAFKSIVASPNTLYFIVED